MSGVAADGATATPRFITIDSGPMQGCVRLDWGDSWGGGVGILFMVYCFLIPGAVVLSFKGWRATGMFVYPVLFILGITMIEVPWCGIDAVMQGNKIQMICNIIIVGLFVLAALVNNTTPGLLNKGSPLGMLTNRRLGKPSLAAWANTDLLLVGPLNEFISMSLMEVLAVAIVLTWMAVSVWARYLDLMDTTYGFEFKIGNATRAFGRAMSAATLRCLLLGFVTSQRNTVVMHFLGIPFERAMKWHKMLGRLQIVCMYIHLLAMLAGGTEVGYTWYTKAHNAPEQVQWKNTLNMYGSGTNLFAGPIAAFFWTLLVVASMPYFRRKMLETFYFTHVNLFFVANIFTVFHARAQLVPWIAPAAVSFYIDAIIRFLVKYTAVQALECKVVGDDMLKLVLKQDGFPLGTQAMHPGAYVWLSCHLRNKTPAAAAAASSASPSSSVELSDLPPAAADGLGATKEAGYSGVAPSEAAAELSDIFCNIKVPGGPPSGLPSWIWFHPITVSSHDPATGAITLYIKSFGEGTAEWSGQLLAAARLVEAGTLSLEDIGFHIGGPNGSLMIKEPLHSLDHLVMVSGGIGCTPMVALLEDLVRRRFAGKIDFVWSTRSTAEVDCFRDLFAASAALAHDKVNIAVHFTGKADSESAAYPKAGPGFTVTAGRPSLPDYFAGIAQGTSCAVLCCGPEALMLQVERLSVDAQRAGKAVLFHREIFEF